MFQSLPSMPNPMSFQMSEIPHVPEVEESFLRRRKMETLFDAVLPNLWLNRNVIFVSASQLDDEKLIWGNKIQKIIAINPNNFALLLA